MRNTTAIAATLYALAAAVSGPALIRSAEAQPAPGTSAPAAGSATAYVEKAGRSDLFEIESSRLALNRASDAEVKAFARMMTEDHAKSSERIKAAASKDGVPMKPPALDADKKAKLEALERAQGAEFDRMYLTEQAAGHEQALQLHRAYAAGGTAPALRSAAEEIAPVVQAHLQRVTALIEKRAR